MIILIAEKSASWDNFTALLILYGVFNTTTAVRIDDITPIPKKMIKIRPAVFYFLTYHNSRGGAHRPI